MGANVKVNNDGTEVTDRTPTGAIIAYGAASPPADWLLCDGSAVSRTTYAALFTIVGETWGGGDGATTFNVPDLQGAFLRGAGMHASRTMANGSPYAGPAVGGFEDDKMQGHEHSVQTRFGPAGGAERNQLLRAGSSAGTIRDNHNPQMDGYVSDSTNGAPRTGPETSPFSAGVNYIIKT